MPVDTRQWTSLCPRGGIFRHISTKRGLPAKLAVKAPGTDCQRRTQRAGPGVLRLVVAGGDEQPGAVIAGPGGLTATRPARDDEEQRQGAEA